MGRKVRMSKRVCNKKNPKTHKGNRHNRINPNDPHSVKAGGPTLSLFNSDPFGDSSIAMLGGMLGAINRKKKGRN